MTGHRRWFVGGMAIILCMLGGCAGMPDSALARPRVSLQDVQVVGLGFDAQVFLLTFDVSNDNPFSLPVQEIHYDVRLDGYRFASGQAASDMSIPAAGVSRFAISVELDLLHTAPQLVSIVRNGARRDIPYEVSGQFELDLPMTPAVAYRNSGAIRLQ